MLKISLSKFNLRYINSKKDIIKGHALEREVFGKPCKIVITYNEKTAYNQKKRTKRALSKAVDYLKEAEFKLNGSQWKDRDKVLIRINTNLTKFHAKEIINWQLEKRNKKLELSFSKNKKQLDYLENSYGKNILFTDNHTLSSEEIIKAYHDKYIVEQSIKRLKNKHIISFTPQFCWTDDSIRVHAFTCVMALLFLSLLRKKVSGGKIDLSDGEIIEHLKEIRQGLLLMPKSKKIQPMIEKMGQTQKKLYSLLNLQKYES